MPQPGEPLALTSSDIKTIEDWYRSELADALPPHLHKEEQLDKWQKGYAADAGPKRKTFPFPGACVVTIPLIGIAVDSIVARIVNTIFAPRPFWTINPTVKDLYDQAKSSERFLDWSRRVEFDLYGEIRKWAIEVVKFGWSYLKTRWAIDHELGFERDPKTGKVRRTDDVRSRAVVEHVLLADMVHQVDVEDDDNAEWVAQRFRLTDTQVRWRGYHRLYQDVDDLLRQKEDITDQQERLTSASGVEGDDGAGARRRLNTFYEVWADIPVKKHSVPSIPALLTYHRPSGKFIRGVHHPYLGMSPYVKGKFIELEGRREGFGIARRLWQLQQSITTIHRQGVDNGTLANTRFFLARKGSGLRPGSQIWPGRLLFCSDPDRDFKAFQMGDIYQSNRQLEISELAYAERASGISDPQLGRESNVLGSRATATGTLAIIQEGNRRFDLNIRDMREALSKVGRNLLQLNQQFRESGFAYELQGAEAGEFTEQTFDMPERFIRHKFGIELTASTSTINRDVERQGLIALLTIVMQQHKQMLENALIAVRPELPEPVRQMAIKAAEGSRLLLERIVEGFDVQDVGVVVPSVAEEIANAADHTTQGRIGTDAAGAQAIPDVGALRAVSAGMPERGDGATRG